MVKSGFKVDPVVYIDRKKGEATYGVLETVARPNHPDQMHYGDPDKDPLAQILERGRREKRIAVLDGLRDVPAKSRSDVSWDETHNFVVPEVINTIPDLKELVTKSGIVFRVPTRREFLSAGEKYSHFWNVDSWEWLYDDGSFDDWLFGDYRNIVGGGFKIDNWPSNSRAPHISFRLLAVSPPQKLL